MTFTEVSKECPFGIEISPEVLDEIRMAVVDAYYSVPRGGIEIGGVLIGSAGKQGVHIESWRAIECRHALGPSFTLSPEDRDALAAQLKDLAKETKNAGLQPVGWFHSHTRSEIFLSTEDIGIFDQFFPGKRQVALVLHPKHMEPTLAAFFFRESNGTIRADTPYAQFPVIPQPRKRRVEVQAEAVTAPAEVPEAEDGIPITEEAPAQVADPRPARRWVSWMLVLAALLILVGGAAVLLRPYLGYETSEALGLEAFDLDGQLLIKWNPTVRSLRDADSATLQIIDGVDKKSMVLDRRMLRIGAIRYFRQNRRVELTLIVPRQNRTPVDETMMFSGPVPVIPPPPNNDALVQRNRQLEQNAEKLKRQVEDWKRAWRRMADAKKADDAAAPAPAPAIPK